MLLIEKRPAGIWAQFDTDGVALKNAVASPHTLYSSGETCTAKVTELKVEVVCKHSQDGLKRLWEHAFPGVPWQGVQADKWVDMGWQRNNPSSDFRGAGLIALHNHLYMAQVGPPQRAIPVQGVSAGQNIAHNRMIPSFQMLLLAGPTSISRGSDL